MTRESEENLGKERILGSVTCSLIVMTVTVSDSRFPRTLQGELMVEGAPDGQSRNYRTVDQKLVRKRPTYMAPVRHREAVVYVAVCVSVCLCDTST